MRGLGKRELIGRQKVETNTEGEPALRSRVKVLREVRGAHEGQRVAFHPCQHFIDLRYLPTAFGTAPVGQQAVRLVKNQHGTVSARLGKSAGDVLLASADPLG